MWQRGFVQSLRFLTEPPLYGTFFCDQHVWTWLWDKYETVHLMYQVRRQSEKDNLTLLDWWVALTRSPFSIIDATFPHIYIKASCEYIMAERVAVKCKYNIIAFYLLIKGLKIPAGLVQFILCRCLKEKKSRNICTDDCRIRQTLSHRLVSETAHLSAVQSRGTRMV